MCSCQTQLLMLLLYSMFPLGFPRMQALLSRAELGMTCGVLSDVSVMDIAQHALAAIVYAWRHQERLDDAHKRKQAQSVEYKTQSHQVCVMYMHTYA